MFLKASRKWLTITKALAFYTTEFITIVKSFVTQAPGLAKQTFVEVERSWTSFILMVPSKHGQDWNFGPRSSVHISLISFLIFLSCFHVLFHSSLLVSIQAENGQDYQSWTTLNKTEQLCLIYVLLKQKHLV